MIFRMDKVEILILRNLIYNEEYLRKVVPFIKADYFEDPIQRTVFEEVSSFVQEYNQPATKEVLCIEVESRQDINESSFKDVINLINELDESTSEFRRKRSKKRSHIIAVDWELQIVN